MKVTILRGLPGSGKSRHANLQPVPTICSADDFPGLYQEDRSIDFSKLGPAHSACMRRFIDAVQAGKPDVFVDNTNTSAVELAPYLAVARAYGIEPTILQFDVSVETAMRRNTHGVPEAGIRAMAARLEEPLPPFFPPVTRVSGE